MSRKAAVSVAVIFAINVANFWSISPASAQTAPLGWRFQKTGADSLLRAHADQIGVLNEEKSPSHFFTVPVVFRRAVGLSNRSHAIQLDRLEKEVRAFLDSREKEKPGFKRSKILNNVPTIEMEFGKSGKGLRWAHAAVHGDHILILFGESRDVKPPAGSRDEFFKMAREFLPPTPVSE